jgi:hypothetical protein
MDTELVSLRVMKDKREKRGGCERRRSQTRKFWAAAFSCQRIQQGPHSRMLLSASVLKIPVVYVILSMILQLT